jgi:hypothetical protein
MDFEKLSDIWEKGNEKILDKNKLSKAMITEIINKKHKKTTSFLNFNLGFYWMMQVVNLILISMNIVGYWQNTSMVWVLGGQMAITLPVMIYGIYIFIKNREINNFSENLNNLLQKQILFFRTYYEVWIFFIALTTLILMFNVTVMVDNMDGHYRINHVVEYIIVNTFVFLLIYLTQKMAAKWRFKALKANLSDIQKGILEESEKFEKTQRKFRWVWILIVVLLTTALIFGILLTIKSFV